MDFKLTYIGCHKKVFNVSEGKRMKDNEEEKNYDLQEYCQQIRKFLNLNMFHECEILIKEAMIRYPHSAKPHNWMGVILKEKRDLMGAMKHFRAACALEPEYLPSRYNLEQCGNIFSKHVKVALDESECILLKKRPSYKVEYDRERIGHVVKQ